MKYRKRVVFILNFYKFVFPVKIKIPEQAETEYTLKIIKIWK